MRLPRTELSCPSTKEASAQSRTSGVPPRVHPHRFKAQYCQSLWSLRSFSERKSGNGWVREESREVASCGISKGQPVSGARFARPCCAGQPVYEGCRQRRQPGRCRRTVEMRLAFAPASGSVTRAKSIKEGTCSSKTQAQAVGRLSAKFNAQAGPRPSAT